MTKLHIWDTATAPENMSSDRGWTGTSLLTRLAAIFAALVLVTSGVGAANAHPEDEFCRPGEGGGLDPALCRALSALDSADRAATIDDDRFERVELNDRTALETAWLYLQIGVRHILPGGTDHILFVLALFLSTRRLKSLALQITAFTVAHTATLGLASAGVVSPPASIVEPLIAATIAYVAAENILFKDMTRWRPLIVFGFGLVHGLGFAGFIGKVGLPADQFWSALIGFNVGVEIGQLSVVAFAAILGTVLMAILNNMGRPALYRTALVIPGSLVIGLIGAWWTIERVFF